MKQKLKYKLYESPMLQLIEVEMEQTIAGSQKIEYDGAPVTDTWQDEVIDTSDVDIYL